MEAVEKKPLSEEELISIREELKTCIATILDKINYIYAVECSAWFQDPNEKWYRDFFLWLLLNLFRAESASMKRVFDINVKVKTK